MDLHASRRLGGKLVGREVAVLLHNVAPSAGALRVERRMGWGWQWKHGFNMLLPSTHYCYTAAAITIAPTTANPDHDVLALLGQLADFLDSLPLDLSHPPILLNLPLLVVFA